MTCTCMMFPFLLFFIMALVIKICHSWQIKDTTGLFLLLTIGEDRKLTWVLVCVVLDLPLSFFFLYVIKGCLSAPPLPHLYSFPYFVLIRKNKGGEMLKCTC